MRDFASLFRGREDAHGVYYRLTGAKTPRGKRTSKAESVRLPVTAELFSEHLTAKGNRLGIIPVCSDGKVWWLCIDVDFYDIGDYHPKIAAAIKSLRLPLVQTKSKSGGAHLWIFFEQAIMAEWAKKIADSLVARLDLPALLGTTSAELKEHLDIFPKDTDATNINFWVNLPYYGEECHATGDDGKGNLSLPDFIKYANDRIVSADLLDKKSKEPVKKAERSPLPPCLEWMMQNKVGEGHRDMALTHTAIVYKRAYGDTWEEKLHEFNEANLEPPLRNDEVRKIIKSVRAKEYEYLCGDMKTLYCDKTECRKRKYGVGQEPTELPIEQIEKIDGETPTYIVRMDGRGVVCKPKELYNFMLFRQAAFPILDRFLPVLKQQDWEDIVSDHMMKMQVTEILDVNMRDRVIKQFQTWVSQGCVMDGLDEALAAQQAFFNGKQIIFRGDDFMSVVDRVLKCPRDQTFMYMRAWGVVQLDVDKQPLWCYPVNGPLWFDAEKAKRQ